MYTFQYDTKQQGLNAILKPWQQAIMQTLWQNPQGLTSRTTWIEVNKTLNGDTISRASIINFLEAMHATGILTGEEKTGRGGHYLIYKTTMNETQFKQHIVTTLINHLIQQYPNETKTTIQKYRNNPTN